MSLQAWYPFNGDIKNYGVGNLDLTEVTAPTFVSGKITEKGLSTGAFQWTAEQSASVFNNEAMTIAFWYKALNNSTSGTLIFGNDSMTPPNNRKFTIFSYESMNDLHWSWQNETDKTFTGGSIKGIFPTGVWTHVCFTYQNPNGCVYINGELKQTFSGVSNSSSFAYPTKVISNSANRLIQDLRVYNHCLAPKEVRQIAQGLSLHYKLCDTIGSNLITTMSSGGRSTLVDKYTLNIDFGANQDAYGYFNVSPALTLNKTYTLSFDVNNFPAGGAWDWQLWNNSNYKFTIKDNGHYSFTFTPSAATLPSNYDLTKFLFDDGGRVGPANVVTFSNFKIEEGTVDTAWCPHSNHSTSYTNFTNSIDKESDCSGYRNIGEKISEAIADKDSARYNKSRIFNGSHYVKCENRISDATNVTISAWMKISSYPASGYALAFADHNSRIAFGFYNGNSAIISCGNSTNNSQVISNLKAKWDLNEWHLITIVKTNTAYTFYFDGQEWAAQGGAYGSSNYWTASVDNLLTIGCRNNGSYTDFFNGKMSDFRIYSTALSADAIKDLYDVRASLLENGDIQAYEIIEKPGNIQFQERGIIYSGDFSEIGYLGGMKIKKLDTDGSVWARIHWLDRSTDKTLFANDDEVAFCNKANRFSRMGLVDHFKNYGIPSGYTRLDYIESTGTQYIDTNYYWQNESVKIEMDAIVTSNASNQSLFGNEEKYSGGDRYFGIIPHGSNGNFNMYVGSSGGIGSVSTGLNTRFMMECSTTDAKVFTVKLNGTQVLSKSYTGTVMAYANTSSTHASKGKIYIFSNHNSNSGATPIQNIGGVKLYSFKMYDNNILVRDFIPVKNASNVVGLYDKVYGVFYTTPTGAFTAGPVSPQSLTTTGVYEFMLTYPSASDVLYNRWTQTNSPNAPHKAGTGLQKITTAWQTHSSAITISGSPGSATYAMNVAGNWWAPIGQKSDFSGGIPAADGNTYMSTELWVRINNLAQIKQISMLDNNFIQAFHINET